MVDAMLICGIEAIFLMAEAYYVEQARLANFAPALLSRFLRCNAGGACDPASATASPPLLHLPLMLPCGCGWAWNGSSLVPRMPPARLAVLLRA